jgi:hypothetical protein
MIHIVQTVVIYAKNMEIVHTLIVSNGVKLT